MTPEQVKTIAEAAAERIRFQARREAQHETVRRSHRVTALAGGGEQECARRRKQEHYMLSKWHYECLANHEIQRRIAIRRGVQ